MLNSPVTIEDKQLPNGEHQRVVLFKDFLIDRIYPSMRGPWTRKDFKLYPSEKSQSLWILRFRADVLDEKTHKASQEFLCHMNLDLIGPAERDGIPSSRITISQGQKEITFPKGYALRMDNDPSDQIDLGVMLLNNNTDAIHKTLNLKSTVRFMDDQTAAAHHLIPLTERVIYTVCPTTGPVEPGEVICEPATTWEKEGSTPARLRTAHWMVPPGRQVISTDVTDIFYLPYDTTAHYIWMHVHPHAESLELWDATDKKTVWKGHAKNPSNPEQAQILRTEVYSSVKGIPLYKDHRYRLITIYNNTTAYKVDAMAGLAIYLREKNFPAPEPSKSPSRTFPSMNAPDQQAPSCHP